MFTDIADASTKPVILYNVPSRTGVNIEPSTYAVLAEHPNIVAIKEASGNISQIAELASLVGDKMDIYSGNDDQIVPVLSLGGKGVISVVSNVLPNTMSRLTAACERGDYAEARKLHYELEPLNRAMFIESNPIPCKTALALMGRMGGEMRLPLCDASESTVNTLRTLLNSRYGLI